MPNAASVETKLIMKLRSDGGQVRLGGVADAEDHLKGTLPSTIHANRLEVVPPGMQPTWIDVLAQSEFRLCRVWGVHQASPKDQSGTRHLSDVFQTKQVSQGPRH